MPVPRTGTGGPGRRPGPPAFLGTPLRTNRQTPFSPAQTALYHGL